MHTWLRSYLSDRNQYTVVNGCKSALKQIVYGVLQGSVLGPLLFLIYINDIGLIPNLSSKPKLFADDTNVFIYSRDLEDLNIKCQSTIEKIADWINANKFSINCDKTCYIIVTSIRNTSRALHLNL